MLGSIHDAEDLVQETYLRAWRGFDRFEGRSSIRNWLYKIATMACLTFLESRNRRPLPSGLGAPAEDHRSAIVSPHDSIPWLEPAPDSMFGMDVNDPASIVAARAGIRLAFIAALQHLSPSQRATLILRDVLAMRADEVADILGTTPGAVHSAVRRARHQLELADPAEDALPEPGSAQERTLLDRYVDVFERADIGALVQLVRDDIALEMPPNATWFVGREAVTGFWGRYVLPRPGMWRMVPTRANTQPALAAYQRGPDGRFAAHALHVLTMDGDRISRIVAFLDPALPPAFGLPDILPPAPKE
jgi:RNA polymerase sigma-70 factor (ECF subfamily)